jgi:hypothetical protein
MTEPYYPTALATFATLTAKIDAQAAHIAELEAGNQKMKAALQLIEHHYINSYTISELRQIAKDAQVQS